MDAALSPGGVYLSHYCDCVCVTVMALLSQYGKIWLRAAPPRALPPLCLRTGALMGAHSGDNGAGGVFMGALE